MHWSSNRLAKFQKERYAEALATLTKCDQMHPTTLVFLAMTQHQLGERDLASATLTRLREVAKEERWAKDQQTAAFVAEAESLVQPKLTKSMP
jgi:hypothetical protein